MSGLMEALATDHGKLKPFQPSARYFPPMDCLIYIQTDCSYRAQRLTEYVTILLHPENDEAVGVKIKGTRHVIERHLAILRAAGMKISESAAVTMLGIAETALTIDGEEVLSNADTLRRKYEPEVKRLAGEAGKFKPQELALAS